MRKISFLMAFIATAFMSMAQYSNGAFLLTEGQLGTSTGGLFWLNPETNTFSSSSVSQSKFGETSQFATIYSDKIYVTSKQAGSYGGGIFTIADAKTTQSQATFSSLSNDDHNYDGRTFCGVDETKGYLGTSNGIFVIDIIDNKIVKFIDGTECGYKPGEVINGSYYQYDVYGHQIGAMVRVGNFVFASQQNRGIHVIDIETDEIVYTISEYFDLTADDEGEEPKALDGSFGELVLSKDGMLWTTICDYENYSYEHHPEQNKLVLIDPTNCEAIALPIESKISVAWSTWRYGMMQACNNTNRILWKDVCYTEWDWNTFEQISVGKPQICYFDIDNGNEGVFVDVSEINPNYSIYAGFSIDPETDNVYVPVSSNAGYGPWYLLVFTPQGELIGEPIQIPIGEWSDYPAMILFTDDYAPEFNIEDTQILKKGITPNGYTIRLPKSEIVSDKDNLNVGITLDVEFVDCTSSNYSFAITESNELELWMLNSGQATVKLKAYSNGKTTVKEISLLTEDYSTSVELVDSENNAPIEYFNMQGVKTENPTNGVYIKKQGSKITKVINSQLH